MNYICFMNSWKTFRIMVPYVDWYVIFRAVIGKYDDTASRFPGIPKKRSSDSKRTSDNHLWQCRVERRKWLPSNIGGIYCSGDGHLCLFLVDPSLWECITLRPVNGRGPRIRRSLPISEKWGQRKRKRYSGSTTWARDRCVCSNARGV